jgi:hypothetical protein
MKIVIVLIQIKLLLEKELGIEVEFEAAPEIEKIPEWGCVKSKRKHIAVVTKILYLL